MTDTTRPLSRAWRRLCAGSVAGRATGRGGADVDRRFSGSWLVLSAQGIRWPGSGRDRAARRRHGAQSAARTAAERGMDRYDGGPERDPGLVRSGTDSAPMVVFTAGRTGRVHGFLEKGWTPR